MCKQCVSSQHTLRVAWTDLDGGWTGHGEVVLPEVVVPGTVLEHPMIVAWTGQGQPESK